MKYILAIEGQEIPLDETIAANDDVLRTTIAAYMPHLANAEIQRQMKGDTVLIQMLKRAGTKGSVVEVLHALYAALPQLNPALSITWQLKQLELQGNLDIESLIALQSCISEAFDSGINWETAITKTQSNLHRAYASPSQTTPGLI